MMSAYIVKYMDRNVLMLEGEDARNQVRFGIAKARLILEHIDEITKFCQTKGEDC